MGSISALMALLLIASCGIASAADIPVYNGQPISESGITLGGWGSGSAEENPGWSYSGGRSIRIRTEGWFSGGRIDFSEPVRLFSGKPASNLFLLFTIGPSIQSELATSGLDTGWYNRASRRAAGADGFDFGAQSVQKAKIDYLKLTLISDTGRRNDVILPVTGPPEANWIKVAVPLTRLASDGDAEYKLKRILVFSDVADTISIGAIRVVEDNQPIRADIEGNVSFAIGDIVVFKAIVSAGLSFTRVSWDFNDQDGIQEDAVGEIVRHVYRKPGDYTVTMSVTDVDGIKAPVSQTLKVHIQ